MHENRIRQAASGVGATQYCIDESVKYAREREAFAEDLRARVREVTGGLTASVDPAPPTV